MHKTKPLRLIVALLILASVSIQNVFARVTVASPTEDEYDITHLVFYLDCSDTSAYMSGDVLTTAKVVADMSTYVFELDSLIAIDSVTINGIPVEVTTSGDVRSALLPTMLHAGAIFTAKVSYRGTASIGAGFFSAVVHDVSSEGTQMVYTISDPYSALAWWPCKQSLDDKIDTVDMFVTVPTGVKAGSNGIMINESYPDSEHVTYHWQTHYAIDYYLISLAIARYTEYKSFVHFTGSSDSMLLDNFFLDTATFNPTYKPNFDSLSLIIPYFSQLYGRYPFYKEKYGVCYTTLPGGMEHQTMTTIGVPQTYIIAHELTHQWFGDNVTYSTWGNIWLSEAFATYGEQLFLEHFWSDAAARAHRQIEYSDAMSQPAGSVYVLDTTSATTIFDQRLVYDKGAAVVNMLRFMAPADSLFFDVLRTYQQENAGGLANVGTLEQIADSIYGTNLDTFFNQWVFGQGYPSYAVTWNQIGGKVIVKLIQTASDPGSVSLFHTPLQIQLVTSGYDTTYTIHNDADTAIYVFNCPDSVESISFEPNLWVLCKLTGIIKEDRTLGVSSSISAPRIAAFPNPTRAGWTINLPEGKWELTLLDAEGRIVWQGLRNDGLTNVPGGTLGTGNYLLTICDISVQNTRTINLIKL